MILVSVAAKDGCLECIEHLLTRNCDIDIQTEDGRTALICATEEKHYDAAKFLLSRNANTNLQDSDYGIALCEYTSLDIVITLLFCSGYTALFLLSGNFVL